MAHFVSFFKVAFRHFEIAIYVETTDSFRILGELQSDP